MIKDEIDQFSQYDENTEDSEFSYIPDTKRKLNKKEKSAIVILIMTLLIEFSYFGYFTYAKKQEIHKLNSSIEESNAVIKSISNMSNNVERINSDEKKRISEKHGNQSLKTIGIETTSVDVTEKISKKGANTVYFIVKIYYNAEDLDSVKNLIALKAIDPDVYKIIKVTDKYIEVILKEE